MLLWMEMFGRGLTMKMMVVLLSGLLLASPQVFADLSVADLEKISEIVKESETRMKEYVSQEIAKVNTRITELDKRLTNQISEVEKRLTNSISEVEKGLTVHVVAVDTQVGRNYSLIIGFIALIIFAVGIPQIITAFQGRKLREQEEKYEELKQEIEILKQQIVRP